MPKVPLDVQITDLIKFYRTEHNIYGRCPCCGEGFRLSEVKLTYGKEPPRDMLTKLKQANRRAEDANARLQERMEDMQADHDADMESREGQWRDRVDLEVEKQLVKEKRDLRHKAIAQSRRTMLGKVIERIAPWFTGSGHMPADVRPIFDPLDFVVFEGLYTGEVSEIVFVEFKTGDCRLTPTQRSIREAVGRKRVRFEELRMSRAKMETLACGKALDRGAAALETRGMNGST